MAGDQAAPGGAVTISRRTPFARHEGDRSARARMVLVILVALLAATALFSLASGASDASILPIVRDWFAPAGGALSQRSHLIIMEIRLPRMLLGALVGASLAVSGAVMQGLFRNPLADPGIIGISAGASLGAATMIVLGGTALAPLAIFFGVYALPIAAFAGGLAVTTLLYRISTREGRTSIATMLLAGIAIAAMALAFTGLLIYLANDQQLRDLSFWMLGSLAGSTWSKLWAVAPIILPALAASPFLARALNALSLGEASAAHLGVPVQFFKMLAVLVVSAATGASVAVSGAIGFVGIVCPHLLRLLIGPDHRYLLPASALLGATLLLLADAASRTVVAPAELPIGILTAAVGGPFFLWILLRRRGVIDL
ncbi:MAG: iron ABC transporter permease [Rhizobiaceae bacterium]|nr:MAG: iron ABC transporter permease [Rhizobiaceae bacterium]